MSEIDKTRSKMTPVGDRTREQLILTAERLFASQGIDNVSLRQINSEAGQRNSSAAHYHFGSKESLIHAVYTYRMANVDERRKRMIAALPAEEPRSARTLIELVVLPIIEEIEHSEGGRNYIRFLAQLIGHPQADLVSIWQNRLAGSLSPIYQDLRKAIAEVPDEVFGPRFGLVWMLTIEALAGRERLASSGKGAPMLTLPTVYVSNLVDTLTGMMSAPSSELTLSGIRALRAGNKQLA